METKYDEIESAEKMRKVFIGAAVGVWLWNVLDAALIGPANPKLAQKETKQVNRLGLFVNQVNGKKYVGVSFKF